MNDAKTWLVVGLDGGGTSTRALVLDGTGAVLSEAIGGACTVSTMAPEDALRTATATLRDAIDKAGASFGDVRAICAGVAGVSVEPARRNLEEEIGRFFPAATVTVVPDYAVAYTGALGGDPGVVVIAGTGSIAYGEDGTGISRRAGGYGYLVADAGSGFSVGRAAISAVLEAADGSGERTSLTEDVLCALGLAAVEEVVGFVYSGSANCRMIAGIAPLVAKSAMAGDAVAHEILVAAGESLAKLAAAVVHPLFGEDPASVAVSGGLWQAGPVIRNPFKRALQVRCPAANVRPSAGSPVEGAAQRALRML